MTNFSMKRLVLPIVALCCCMANAIDLTDLLNPDAAILKESNKTKQTAQPAPKAKAPAPPAPKAKEPVQPATKAEEPVQPAPKAKEPAPAADPIKAKASDVSQAQLELERAARAKAEAASKKARGDLAEAEAERKALEKQRAELEARLKAAEAARRAAEKKAAAAEEARQKSEEEIGDVAKKVLAERQAREEAESARRVAEQRAENERRAAEKAVADKAAAEKRLNYLMNPDPDERMDPPKKDAAPKPAEKDAAGNAAEKAVPPAKAADAPKKSAATPKKELTGRDAVITAERTDYDRKEGVILFDRNVHVDDEQYQMHSDRLFVFLDGTNELKRLVAIGHVAITNDEKTAYCARATYSKATGKIVMYSNDEIKAKLCEGGKKGSTVVGQRITFWTNSEQVEVDNPVISMPGGGLKGGDAKNFLQGGGLGGIGKSKDGKPNGDVPKGEGR